MRNAHVFVVDENTFPVVRERLVAGIGINEPVEMHPNYTFPNNQKPVDGRFWRGTLDDFYADLARMREGDLAFFYNQGDNKFYGIYELEDPPYFDSNVVTAANGRMGENRSLRTNLKIHTKLMEGVAEDRALFDPTDKGKLWVLISRKARGERSVLSIPPDHSSKLARLLHKNNDEPRHCSTNPYRPSSPQTPQMPFIVLNSSGVGSKRLRYEKRLEAWFMKHIDVSGLPILRSIFGPVEDLSWFANDIPYTSAGAAMDMMVFHSRENLEGERELYKISVVELKNTGIGLEEIQQVEYYTDWATKWLAGGDYAMVQPILVGSYVKREAKKYLTSRKKIEAELARGLYKRPLRTILYEVRSDNVIEHELEGEKWYEAGDGRIVLCETSEDSNFEFVESS